MLYVVEKQVNDKIEYVVVECDNHRQAINRDAMFQLITDKETGETTIKNSEDEVSYLGVYEIGQTNLLDDICRINDVHSFYAKRLKEIGIDSATFEKIKEEK